MVDGSLYVIIPIILIFKIFIWGIICYRRSERHRTCQMNRGIIVANQPNTIIRRQVILQPHEIRGIENPGYAQQPPAYTSAADLNSLESGTLPSYDEVVKSSYYPPNTNQEPTIQN